MLDINPTALDIQHQVVEISPRYHMLSSDSFHTCNQKQEVIDSARLRVLFRPGNEYGRGTIQRQRNQGGFLFRRHVNTPSISNQSLEITYVSSAHVARHLHDIDNLVGRRQTSHLTCFLDVAR